MSQTPWFNNSTTRQQFNLSDARYNRLRSTYRDLWSRYNQGVTGLANELNDDQRRERMEQLERNFRGSFGLSTQEIFTSSRARDRFNQLDLQYRSFGAFRDPVVQQQLNLTTQQQLRLSRLGRQWTREMNAIGRTYASDPAAAEERFNELNSEAATQVDSLLNRQQQKAWQNLTGETYEFPAQSYFVPDQPANPRQ